VSRSLAVVLTASAVVWCGILLIVPAAAARGGPHVAAPLALIYGGAGLICHQRPERSFRVAGVQQPVCARCFGLYASGAAGALLGWAATARRRGISRGRLFFVLAAVPTAVTFLLEFTGVAASSSAIRALAAVPLGLVAGWLFVRSLRDEAMQ
jgi:uncharacterized membrane protein